MDMDEPTLGSYFGEQIDLILAFDPDNTNFVTFISDYWNFFEYVASKFDPYKTISMTPIPPESSTLSLAYLQSIQITDQNSFQVERARLSERIAGLNYEQNHKFLVVWFCPRWSTGTHMQYPTQENNYIFSNVVLRNGPGIQFPIVDDSLYHHLIHEIGHAFCLHDSASIPDVAAYSETAMASGMGYAEDELNVISHIQFNNRLNMQKNVFGCRAGNEIPWIHKYQNTQHKHEEYSATWEETEPFISTINNGSSFFSSVCGTKQYDIWIC